MSLCKQISNGPQQMRSNCHGHSHHSSMKVTAETMIAGEELSLLVTGEVTGAEGWLFPDEP